MELQATHWTQWAPPVLVGERVLWLGGGSGLPQGGTVRWMGKIPEIGPSWTVGIELDLALPYGGIDGWWGGRHLFTCEPRHGLLVPVSSVVRERDVCGPDRRRSVGVPVGWSQPRLQHANSVPVYSSRGIGSAPASGPPEQPAAGLPGLPGTQHPKPAARRKNALFVQSLPLVEEETRQAVYDTRDCATPAAPPRKNGPRLTRSGDYSVYNWYDARDQQVAPGPDPGAPASTTQDAAAEDRMVPQVPEEPPSDPVTPVRRRSPGPGPAPGPSARKEKTNSGFFSFFRWFKKNKEDGNDDDLDEDVRTNTAPSSPLLSRSRASSAGSADTVLSSATVSSFAFVAPAAYRLGPSSPVQRRLVTAETDTYRRRIRQRDRRREVERNISLRKKYRLYGSDSTIRVSTDSLTRSEADLTEAAVPDVVVPSLGRKKRQAPQPPVNRYSDYSLPATLEHRRADQDPEPDPGTESATLCIGRYHRRTVSDGSAQRRALVHVRGKRRAPTPPNVRDVTPSPGTTPCSTAGRTKRRAPQPPGQEAAEKNRIQQEAENERLETERLENERLEKERAEKEKLEKERLEKEQLEKDRLERERSEKDRLEKERLEKDRLERERLEKERLEKERLETERLENERLEKERLDKERLEKERTEKERLEKERIEKERLVRERFDKESAERERLRLDKLLEISKAESLQNERLKKGKLEKQRLEREELENRRLEKEEVKVGTTQNDRIGIERLERERLEKERLKKAGEKEHGLSSEEKQRLLGNISKLQAHASREAQSARLGSPPASPSSRDMGFKATGSDHATVAPPPPLSPVSPRPWYKRSSTHRDSGGFRDIFKSLEKKRDRDRDEDWMPESGIPRSAPIADSTASKFNIFSRLTEDRKKDKDGEKRKSQVSMLANISELDREAAEIVQEQHARAAALQAAYDAKFYTPPQQPADEDEDEEAPDNVEVPRRNSAKELISLFNAIGNVTKVTVNSSFFSKEGLEKRFSFMSERSKSNEDERSKKTSQLKPSTSSPYTKRKLGSSPGTAAAPLSEKAFVRGGSIPIASADDDEENARGSKSDELFKVNKSKRHNSPVTSIPPITEQPEPGTSANRDNEKASIAASDATPTKVHVSKETTSGAATTSIVSTTITTVTNDSGATVRSSGLTNGFSSAEIHPPEPLLAAKRLTIWVCPRCTLENPRWRFTCDACSMWRPAERKEKSAPVEDGDKVVQKGPINWEEELKKYFKKDGGNTQDQNERSILQDAKPGPSDKKVDDQEPTIKKVEAQTKPISSLQPLPMPSTFIGGRLKQDDAKSPATKATTEDPAGKVLGGKPAKADDEKPAAKPDVEEVRKARLAFFRNSATFDIADDPVREETQPHSSNKSDLIEDERLKLREMLKEMKDSLPKRGRFKADGTSKQQVNGHDALGKAEGSSVREEVSKKSCAGSKGVTERERGSEKMTKPVACNGCSLIPTQTAPEDVKLIKKSPMKVSSSAQTSSAVVRKLEPSVAGTPSSSSVKVPAAPPPATSIQGGVLYTSLRKDARRIGTGTFELLRPKDFASIEATKTGNERLAGHLYVNVPNRASSSSQHAAPTDIIPERRSSSSVADSAGFETATSVSSIPSSQASGSSVQSGPSSVGANVSAPDGSSSGRSGVTSPSSRPSSVSSSSYSAVQTYSSATASSEPSRTPSSLSRTASSDAPSSAGQLTRGASTDSRVSDSRSEQSESGSSTSRTQSVVSDCSEVDRLTAQLSAPQGIADFKAALNRAHNVNTLAVNRLLRRLEASIAGGQHQEAARLARDLARLKISCSVTRQRRQEPEPNLILVEMYVEDKVSHQGPIPLQVRPSMTVGQLRAKVAKEFELPERVQRWILGKQLAADDSRTLQDHQVTESGSPVFLYLVAPDADSDAADSASSSSGNGKSDSGQVAAAAPSVPVTPPARQPPPPDPNRRGGWYYNYEEDRYSFCEDSESDLSDDSEDGPRLATTNPPTTGSEAKDVSPTLITSATLAKVLSPAPLAQAIPPASVAKPMSPAPVTSVASSVPVPKALSPTPVAKAMSPIPVSKPLSPTPVAKALSPTPVAKAPSPTPVSKALSPVPAAEASSSAPQVKPTTSLPMATSSTVAKAMSPLAARKAPSPGVSASKAMSPTPMQKAAPAAPVATAGPAPKALSPVPAPRKVQPTAGPSQPQAGTASPKAGRSQIPLRTQTATSPFRNQPLKQGLPPSPLLPRQAGAKTTVTPQPTEAEPVPGPSGSALNSAAASGVGNSGTLELGWRCSACTLVNPPTRPGCAACASERPKDYRVPAAYKAGPEEAERLKQEEGDREEGQRNYQLLVNLDRQDLVPSMEPFDCSVCLVGYPAGDGVVLRECLHTFCRQCLVNTVQFSEEAEVKCPYRDDQYACDGVVQEREIKALVPPAVYEQHLARSMAQAENKIGNAFHCKTPDCRGWCIFEDNVNTFRCPVCNVTNCLRCEAIHPGAQCAEYQALVQAEQETNEDARRTRAMLDEMAARGEAMSCPSCQAMLMKKWGCDWLRCSMCKTEICWVTRKPRWGPGGKGDTSGGCQCGVNGVKCHPKCNYCH